VISLGEALSGAVPAQAGQAAQGGGAGEPARPRAVSLAREHPELQNVLERACVLSPGPVVEILEELGPRTVGDAATAAPIARQEAIATLQGARGDRRPPLRERRGPPRCWGSPEHPPVPG
jgi:hypothetical protein